MRVTDEPRHIDPRAIGMASPFAACSLSARVFACNRGIRVARTVRRPVATGAYRRWTTATTSPDSPEVDDITSPKDARRAAAGARRMAEDAVETADVLESAAASTSRQNARRMARYARWGDGVKGFMEPGLLRFLLTIDDFHEQRGVFGALCEIGVYHGKSFAPLALLRRPGETCVAVDCFDAQEHNVDDSGVGDKNAFLRNVEAAVRECMGDWGDEANEDLSDEDEDGWLAVIEGDSTAVDAGMLSDAAGGPVRIFSVDGCHTAETTRSDVELASQCLHPEGIVLVDDAFNPDWPGVVTGLSEWCARAKGTDWDLAPFAIGFNKVAMCRVDRHGAYLAAVRDAGKCPSGARVRKSAEFLGWECAVLSHGWIATFHANE